MDSTTPLGHTAYSWTGGLGDKEVPLGHTCFSWFGDIRKPQGCHGSSNLQSSEQPTSPHQPTQQPVMQTNTKPNQGQKSKGESSSSKAKNNSKQPVKKMKEESKDEDQKNSSKSHMLRVLCLHGYMQSGPVFEKKTSSFRFVSLSCDETSPHNFCIKALSHYCIIIQAVFQQVQHRVLYVNHYPNTFFINVDRVLTPSYPFIQVAPQHPIKWLSLLKMVPCTALHCYQVG